MATDSLYYLIEQGHQKKYRIADSSIYDLNFIYIC